MIEELTSAFRSFKNNDTCRSIVLTGVGSSFSAGADLNWMKKMASYTKEENEKDSHLLFDMFHAIRSCSIPVIARVNGPALGGGSGLVSSCDIALSLKSAKFGFTEVKLGLIPAVISPFVMEKIGKVNCSRYFLTGERFTAEEAKQIQLISDHFVTDQELDDAINKISKEIASSGPQAVRTCKSLIQNVSHMDYNNPSTKLYVASEIATARVSAEGQSGISAFLKKGKPMWVK